MMKFFAFATLLLVSTKVFSQVPASSELVKVGNKHMYYEVYGEGTPLLFLHGYSQSSKSWQPYVSNFVDDYRVYLIDLTGHGRSEPFKEDLTFKGVAEDLNGLIQYLELAKIKAVGFSFGGDVLYQLALINPTLIESMITIGAVGTWDVNEFPQYEEEFNYNNRDSFPWLKTSHETDGHIKGLMDQFKNYTVRLTDEELERIQPEVLIMMGDDDEGMNFDEVARAKKYLPESDIWILPNVSHGAHEGENKEEFVLKATAFFLKNTNH